MYDNGVGVVQDNKLAYVWSSVSAANGGVEAATNRDHFAKRPCDRVTDRAYRSGFRLVGVGGAAQLCLTNLTAVAPTTGSVGEADGRGSTCLTASPSAARAERDDM